MCYFLGVTDVGSTKHFSQLSLRVANFVWVGKGPYLYLVPKHAIKCSAIRQKPGLHHLNRDYCLYAERVRPLTQSLETLLYLPLQIVRITPFGIFYDDDAIYLTAPL